eukprot:Skav225340  [mRNA]  locus=scaffold748:442000:443295:+ [translate_table: standard]
MASEQSKTSPPVGDGYTDDRVEPTPVVEQVESSSDSGSDTSSSDGEETEGEKSNKTNDDRSEAGDGGDDQQDPEAEGSTTTVLTRSALEKMIADDYKEFKKTMNDKMTAASSSDDFNDVIAESRARAKFFYDILMEATEKKKTMKKSEDKATKAERQKAQKEAEKDQKREEREAQITLNIMVDAASGQTRPLTVGGTFTIAGLRDMIGTSFFPTTAKKKMKKANLMIGDINLTETWGKCRKNVYKVLRDGDTVRVVFGGAGGASSKRSASAMGGGKMNRNDKVLELGENLTMASLRAQSSSFPMVTKALTDVMNAKNAIEHNTSDALKLATDALSVADMKRLQVSCTSGSPDYKIGVISKAMFKNTITQFDEYKKQLTLVENSMRDVVHILLLNHFGQEDTTSIAWQSFISYPADAIESKSKASVARDDTM